MNLNLTIQRLSALALILSLYSSSALAQVPFWESFNQAYTDGGSGNSIREIASDPEGGIIVTGRYNGDLEFTGGSAGFGNSRDGFLAKVNRDGSFAWGRGQGRRANDTQCWSVDTDENSNVYVVGDFEFTAFIGGDEVTATGNSFDGFLVSYDKNGNKRWKRIFKGANYISASKVRSDKKDLIVVSGYFDTEVDFGGGQTLTSAGAAQFIVAYDTSGSLQWKKEVPRGEGFTDLRILDDGSLIYAFPVFFSDTVIIDGITAVPANTNNYAFVKTDDQGKAEWVKQFGTSAGSNIRNLYVGSNGEFYVGGMVTDTVTYNGNDIRTTSGSVGMVYKFNADGSYNSGLEIIDQAVNAISLHDDQLYLSTDFEGSINIGGMSANSSNGRNFLIAQLNTDLTVNWLQVDGSGGGAGYVRISASEEYVSSVGYFGGTIGIGDTSISEIGFNDFFTGNLRIKDYTGIKKITTSNEISLFPNPNSGQFTLNASNLIEEITIHSSLGELVYQENLKGQKITLISLPSSLVNGLYFVSIKTDDGVHTKRLIIDSTSQL